MRLSTFSHVYWPFGFPFCKMPCELFNSVDFFLLGCLFLIDWWKSFWMQALCSVTGFYKCLGPGLFFHFIWLHGLTSSSSLLLWGSDLRSKPKGKGFTRLPLSLQALGTNPHCISPQRLPSLLVSQLLPWNLHVLSGAPSLGLTSLGCCSPRTWSGSFFFFFKHLYWMITSLFVSLLVPWSRLLFIICLLFLAALSRRVDLHYLVYHS